MSRPDFPGMCTSSKMQDGVLLRATARSAAPSAKQITSYPPADKTIERVSRTAGSSSTTKISPREVVCSAMGDCSCKERRNNESASYDTTLGGCFGHPYLYGL